jgi:poly(3-hydroxybutyrate) depolymerase
MLYQLHEIHHAAVTPLRFAAEAGRHIFRSPFNPFAYTHYGRTMAATCDMVEHTTRRRGKPEFGLDHTTIDGETVPVREEIVRRDTFCQLVHFAREGAGPDDPRLLIVAPLSGHYATLLRGTVGALLPDHDVYITDWRNACMVPVTEGSFDLDDYIDYVMDYLRLLGPGTHVMAVCQPSVPVLATAALMAADGDEAAPRSMVMMGGPIDTRANPTQVNRLAERRSRAWFERTVISHVPYRYPGFLRRVYPGFVQLGGFMTMNLDRHVDAHVRLFNHLVEGDGDSAASHRRFYDEYTAVMDLPAEYYLQTIETVFQRHALPRGRMTWRGHPVDPAAIEKSALMTIEGELDDISGLGQTRAAHDLCTSIPAARKRHHEQKGVGHYGIFNGRKWRQSIAPKVRDFIRANA